MLVVEHDADMIKVADHIVDLGLGAGEQGGRVVYSGTIEGLMQEPRSLTAGFLRGDWRSRFRRRGGAARDRRSACSAPANTTSRTSTSPSR